MTQEGFNMDGEVTMAAVATDVLLDREQFWAPASLADTEMFCGDDGSEDGYLHAFGGLEEVVYGLQVMKEATQPGSVTETLEQSIVSFAPIIKSTGGLKAGLHSDFNNEGGEQFKADKQDGGLGCAKVAKQRDISKLLSDERVEVTQISKRLAPELFENEQDEISAETIANAHGALAARDEIWGSARAVAAAAAKKGVKIQVLDREHSPESAGIMNFKEGTTFQSKSAMESGKPAYSVDIWATDETFDNLRHLYPYDKRSLSRYVVMSSVATFMALGVAPDQIVARR
jgi:hypothetical protein